MVFRKNQKSSSRVMQIKISLPELAFTSPSFAFPASYNKGGIP